MKVKLICSVLFLILLLSVWSTVFAAANLPVVKIGIVKDGTWERSRHIIDIVKQEIISINEGEFDVQFPEEATLRGNWTIASINHAIDRLLSDDDVDMVIAMGHASSHLIAQRRDLPKPAIAPFIIDTELQRLTMKDGTSGVKNLNYIDSFKRVVRDIRALQEIVRFKKVVILADELTLSILEDVPRRQQMISKETKIEEELIAVTSSAQEALDSLPADTGAVMIAPLLRFSDEEFQRLVDGFIEKGLPSYSLWDYHDVELGILASMTAKDNFEHLARNLAVNVHDILRGADAGTLNVVFKPSEQPTINMATARAIDVYPSLSVRTEADLLYEERTDIERVLTLERVVHEALQANLDLAVAQRRVASGAEQVRGARSGLLPQIGIASEAIVIDADTAEASLGRAPERSWTGSASFSQLLYSETVWTNYTTETHRQEARIENRDTVRLDIIRSAATAYLEVMRAKTIERIQKSNLKLTRSNLERASVRVEVGIAAPDEIFRWESEIANQRQIVLESESRTMTSMNNLNRLLNRPIQEEFIAQEIDADEPLMVLSDRMYLKIVSNPKYRKSFRNFMIHEGLTLSPELRRIDAEIAAQKRIFSATKRDFWLPDFALKGNVNELLADGGVGQRENSPLEIDNTEWVVGVFATLPLFTSGQKSAAYRGAREDLSRIEIERQAAKEQVEERILTALNLVRASYPSIDLTRESEAAANKNLDLIIDSYERGIKSIIDLVDAQNLALTGKLRSADAVYNFLIDLMNVQRAVGRFEFFRTREEREDWFKRFEAFSDAAHNQ